VSRELVILGSASQVPTRHRNHNGYLVRFDEEVVLIDPGEGTQRQLLLADIPASAITTICVTHFHGDHCLGLPGVLQRMSLDGVLGPVPVCYPTEGQPYYDRLRHASIYEDHTEVTPVPVTPPDDGTVVPVRRSARAPVGLLAARLRHRVPTVGWRLEEDAGRTMLPDALTAAGIQGPDVSRLQRDGAIEVDGRRVHIDEVSVERPPQRVAIVLDTAWCDGALALADGVDLLLCEATFETAESGLLERAKHLSAWQAGRLAREAGVRQLVITHFSQRYPDTTRLVAQASEGFGSDVIAAVDLAKLPFPPRRSPVGASSVGGHGPGVRAVPA
jgi:ribonuclease Z